jgi:hypothetical protein
MFSSPAHRVLIVILAFAAAALVPAAVAQGPYIIGSSNTVTANFPVTRPSTTPCVVTLLDNAEFDNFNPATFTYTPPAACPGPWAAVIFTASINVTPGIQYDRTANFWLGPTPIYFGTTAEPSPDLGPSWYTESDLTELSPVFTTSQAGTADIGNLVNSTYTGIIYATSTLEFYPLAPGQTAPATANQVYSLSAGPTGGTVGLNDTASQLTGTFTFPTNVTNAYLDIYSQSQSNDEFWYTCVPNDVASELESCNNTGFRETEVSIDGTPAGVAPVSPWIYTGGIDPWLWYPLPGVQTLNFVPYRVDLTPFAATLSNGQPHTVAISVYNANGYFSDTANLLVYQDPVSSTVTGATTKNTLASAPNPVTTENLNVTNTAITGNVKTTSNRSFTVAGYVNTSKGKVSTTVTQSVAFTNNETFVIDNSVYQQKINVTSNVNSTTTVAAKGEPSVTYIRNQQFPLTFDIDEYVTSSGGINQASTSHQTYDVQTFTKQSGSTTYTGLLTNAVSSTDTLEFDSNFNLLGTTAQSSTQLFNNTDSTGVNQVCILTAATNALTSFSSTCPQSTTSESKTAESKTSELKTAKSTATKSTSAPLVTPWRGKGRNAATEKK